MTVDAISFLTRIQSCSMLSAYRVRRITGRSVARFTGQGSPVRASRRREMSESQSESEIQSGDRRVTEKATAQSESATSGASWDLRHPGLVMKGANGQEVHGFLGVKQAEEVRRAS